ncbi:MAG TPA: hypothetical protein VGH04_08540, partial [Gemmatimonadaceae bacterium]
PLAAQQQQGKDKDPTKAVSAGAMPAGWSTHHDHASMSAKFETMGSGFHVTSGGAATYWRAADAQKDNFTVSANFHQAAKGQHAEAYGLFTGGRDLSDDAKQTYLYFEVRQDGMYYIAHRSGANVHKLVDWTASPTIHKIDDTPNATNDLAIKVAADSVRFFVNNTQVNAVPRNGMTADESGDVGLRVNHNLSVHVASFAVKPGAK